MLRAIRQVHADQCQAIVGADRAPERADEEMSVGQVDDLVYLDVHPDPRRKAGVRSAILVCSNDRTNVLAASGPLICWADAAFV